MRLFKGLFLTVFIITWLTISRQNCAAQQGGVDEVNWPQVLPPSPEAAKLSILGDVTNDLATGKAAVSISLLTYKTPNIELPIRLNYSTSGFKVNEIASRVGMGWTLTAGGVISRTINGKPDDKVTFDDSNKDFTTLTGAALRNALGGYLNGTMESEPDIYHYSFLSFNGSFALCDHNIVKMDDNNLVISGDVSGFDITTPDGTIYAFNEIESTEVLGGHLPGVGSSANNNAWLMTSIKFLNGEEIYFKYNRCTFNYEESVSQTFTTPADEDNTPPDPNCPDCPNFPLFADDVVSLKNNGAYLREISSNRRTGVVVFDYLPRPDITGDYYVSRIALFDGKGGPVGQPIYYTTEPIKEFLFGYQTANAITVGDRHNASTATQFSKRLFLKFVTAEEGDYVFDYNSIESLPYRLSFCQDAYGYFNGKSNRSMIPSPSDPADISLFQGYGFGDRSPNYLFSQKGLLKKISYPTGGSVELIYEANTVTTERTCSDLSGLPTNATVTAGAGSTNGNEIVEYSNTFTLSCSQQLSIHFGSEVLGGGDPKSQVKIGYVDSGPPPAIDDIPIVASVGQGNSNVVTLTLPAGSWRLALIVDGGTYGFVSMNYRDYPTGFFTEEVGGVRLKTKRSFDGTKYEDVNYVYDDPATGFSSGTLMHPEVYFGGYRNVKVNCGMAGLGTSYICKSRTYNSFTKEALTDSKGYHIVYKKVTEKYGENFENGAIQHTFMIHTDGYGSTILGDYIPRAGRINLGVMNGLETEKAYIKQVNGQNVTVKREQYSYKLWDNSPPVRTYYAVRKEAGFVTDPTFETLQNYPMLNITKYTLSTRWYYLESVKTTDYDFMGNSIQTIEKTMEYANDSYKQLVSQSEKMSSGQLKRTRFKYPYNFNSAVFNSMVADHYINVPVETIEYVDNKKVDSIKYEYQNPSSHLYVPLLVQKYNTQTNQLYPFIRYLSYDTNGNIRELKREDGITVTYLWGYGGLYPIAEAENATYSELVGALGSSGAAILTGLNNVDVSETQITSVLNTLRNHISLKKAFVKGYTFKPLLGVTSSTDASGRTVYYDYDDAERLWCIRDHFGNVVEEYKYNYRQ